MRLRFQKDLDEGLQRFIELRDQGKMSFEDIAKEVSNRYFWFKAEWVEQKYKEAKIKQNAILGLDHEFYGLNGREIQQLTKYKILDFDIIEERYKTKITKAKEELRDGSN